MSTYIAAIGRNTIDIYYTCPHGISIGEKVITSFSSIFYGGIVPNTICNLSSLGLDTVLFDTIGIDQHSKSIVKELEKYGVDTSCIRYSKDCTVPEIQILIPDNPTKYPSTIIVPQDDNRPYVFTDRALSYLQKADILYTTLSDIQSTETLDIVRFAKDNKIRIVLDVEVSSFSERAGDIQMLQEADMLFFNHLGFMKYAHKESEKEVLQQLFNKNVKVAVVTRGENGCSVYTPDKTVHIPGIPVDCVDTTGAGDSFNAVFLWSYLKNGVAEQAAITANKAAALSTTVKGPRSLSQFIREGQLLL